MAGTKTIVAVVAAGETTSGIVNLTGRRLKILHMPASATGITSVTFQAAPSQRDPDLFQPFYSDGGEVVSVAVFEGRSIGVDLAAQALAAIGRCKLVLNAPAPAGGVEIAIETRD